MLWAWERPEDLRFIDTDRVGVAFLAATAILRGDTVVPRPRMQPLQVPPGTTLKAVVRVEVARLGDYATVMGAGGWVEHVVRG